MLSCSIWFSAPSFWVDGGLENRCVGRVYGADGAVHGTIRNAGFCSKDCFVTQTVTLSDTKECCSLSTRRYVQ